MLPFAWLMSLTELNDVYAYLATLLLTGIAHRSIIEAKLSFVQRLTAPDVEFILTLTLTFAQMVLILVYKLACSEVVVFTEVDSPFAFEEGLTYPCLFFAGEMLLLLARFFVQTLKAVAHHRMIATLERQEDIDPSK